MTPKVQVGTVLIEERPLIAQVLGLESVELLLHCH
jgi:hypothetical protein